MKLMGLGDGTMGITEGSTQYEAEGIFRASQSTFILIEQVQRG